MSAAGRVQVSSARSSSVDHARGSASSPIRPLGSRRDFWEASRLSVAIARVYRVTKTLSSCSREACVGYGPSIAFVSLVGLSMLSLGIYLVVYGEKNEVTDLMVVGGLCLAVGFFAVVLGLTVIIRTARKRCASRGRESTSVLPAAGTHHPDDRGSLAQPGPSNKRRGSATAARSAVVAATAVVVPSTSATGLMMPQASGTTTRTNIKQPPPGIQVRSAGIADSESSQKNNSSNLLSPPEAPDADNLYADPGPLGHTRQLWQSALAPGDDEEKQVKGAFAAAVSAAKLKEDQGLPLAARFQPLVNREGSATSLQTIDLAHDSDISDFY